MNKVLLMILDGWGIGKHDKTDAIFNTPTPFMNSLSEKYPHAQLLTCGENVGLPDGQMGNFEYRCRTGGESGFGTDQQSVPG